ncbi:MAG TPA: VOC family protein [Candidatus Dormibacteraeota bacterium]|nr:VOC family protein [Candidatus Dormibacteraeota bacterium]
MTDNDWPLGALEIKVLDLDREVAFYEWFGLSRISGDKGSALLGADGRPILLLSLLEDGRERPRHTAGLYHFAILLADERELGGFLQRTLEERLPLTGTSDHLVSQALYFDDPEGNGIEVYADRPRSEWQYSDGHLNIGLDHLDFERLLRIADKPKPKFSPETVLGHMHLNVGDLDASQAFYESLGMELMGAAGRVMRFMSWDGYHHHLGINVLEGQGAAPVEPDVRGLRRFQIRRIDHKLADPDRIELTPTL